MSRLDLNGDKPKNPAKYFLEWVSDEKCFQYYKKYNEDEIKNGVKGENIKVPLPVKFLVLDTLSTIKGWDDNGVSSYWSNEVKNINTDILIVRTKKGIVAKGLYNDLKGNKNCNGIKYCQSVYIAIKENNEYILANIQFKGSALGEWIEYRKNNNIFKDAIEIATSVEATKGKTTYNKPVFKKIKASQEVEDKAIELTKELQEFLKQYFSFSNNNTEQEENIKSDDFSENIEKEVEDDFVTKSDDLPF